MDACAGPSRRHAVRRRWTARGDLGRGERAAAAEVTRVLFPRALDPHQAGFALTETLAHLEHLRGAGEFERAPPPAGAGGAAAAAAVRLYWRR